MQEPAYTRTAVALHWLIAVCIIAQIALGLWMIGIPKDPPGVRAWWFNLHKSIGLTLGMLILLRVRWRVTHRAPPLPATLPKWQRIAATASHHVMYLCMVLMPVSGYLGSNFTKYPIVYFGTRLPHWGWDAPALKEICSTVHLTTAVILIILIAAHIAAALKHRFVDRDGVFERMLVWRKPGATAGN
jgi:cytochrome b561